MRRPPEPELPVLWYRPGQRSIGHSQIIRMSIKGDRVSDEVPLRLCLTEVPAVMCECRKFFLACRHEAP
jgi:hypothetical protein